VNVRRGQIPDRVGIRKMKNKLAAKASWALLLLTTGGTAPPAARRDKEPLRRGLASGRARQKRRRRPQEIDHSGFNGGQRIELHNDVYQKGLKSLSGEHKKLSSGYSETTSAENRTRSQVDGALAGDGIHSGADLRLGKEHATIRNPRNHLADGTYRLYLVYTKRCAAAAVVHPRKQSTGFKLIRHKGRPRGYPDKEKLGGELQTDEGDSDLRPRTVTTGASTSRAGRCQIAVPVDLIKKEKEES
jgi:hypothetical protein